jgi:hypothetical protein
MSITLSDIGNERMYLALVYLSRGVFSDHRLQQLCLQGSVQRNLLVNGMFLPDTLNEGKKLPTTIRYITKTPIQQSVYYGPRETESIAPPQGAVSLTSTFLPAAQSSWHIIPRVLNLSQPIPKALAKPTVRSV